MWYQGSAKESLCTTEGFPCLSPIIYLDEHMRYHIADLFRQYFLKPPYRHAEIVLPGLPLCGGI